MAEIRKLLRTPDSERGLNLALSFSSAPAAPSEGVFEQARLEFVYICTARINPLPTG